MQILISFRFAHLHLSRLQLLLHFLSCQLFVDFAFTFLALFRPIICKLDIAAPFLLRKHVTQILFLYQLLNILQLLEDWISSFLYFNGLYRIILRDHRSTQFFFHLG